MSTTSTPPPSPAPPPPGAPAGGPVRVGDPAPDFERPDHQGRPFRLSAMRGRCVVVFFYPKDYTPGCTAQSCRFRDGYEQFTAAGAEVVGISSDAPSTHAGFAGRYRLPFRLLSDADGSLRRLWGVPRTLGLLPGRVTYVVGPDGVVRHRFSSQWRIGTHVQRALDVVRSLSAPRDAGAGLSDAGGARR
jgi:peroxiredoxin Q/BCP